MAKAATKKKGRAHNKPGPMRAVPKEVHTAVEAALAKVRTAKVVLLKKNPRARKAFQELHNVESRLSRLS